MTPPGAAARWIRRVMAGLGAAETRRWAVPLLAAAAWLLLATSIVQRALGGTP
ncbi:hypothetical protein [Streptomyces misionensis]|uniref:hypothetical protein n=1 Tax=Streptomyces misionensis TaxID=67331 RepID=UPI0033AB97FB